GRECFCDHEITSAKVDDSECAAPCTGQANEVCGGSERLTVYKPPVYSPKTNPGDGSTFTYLGCYPDSVENRLLPVEPMDGPDVTIPKCVHECRNAGFISNSTHTAYAGVEYGQKCFCGINTVLPDPAPGSLPAVTGCDIPCKGDGNELCGGANHLNIY
ncbi:WSC-domain-containing protein, partial [Bimuria novae-zelandiae CBS 107.79]